MPDRTPNSTTSPVKWRPRSSYVRVLGLLSIDAAAVATAVGVSTVTTAVANATAHAVVVVVVVAAGPTCPRLK